MILNAYVERTDIVSRSGTSGVYLAENQRICVSVILISRKTRNVVWNCFVPQDVREWRI